MWYIMWEDNWGMERDYSLNIFLLFHPEDLAHLPHVPISCCLWSFLVAMEKLPFTKTSLLFLHMTLEIYPRINKEGDMAL